MSSPENRSERQRASAPRQSGGGPIDLPFTQSLSGILFLARPLDIEGHALVANLPTPS